MKKIDLERTEIEKDNEENWSWNSIVGAAVADN